MFEGREALPMIRPYRESDLEAVALLFTDSVHHVANSHYDLDQLAAWAPRPPDLRSWKARLAPLKTLVAETDGKLAGFISFEFNGHIELLYASPLNCRRGVASALFRHAEAAIAARGVADLFTEASLAARAFFESVGFKVIEEQCVQRSGITLRRFAMRKSLTALAASGGASRPHDNSMGKVEHIFIAPRRGEPMVAVANVEAIADCGLIGDRYSDRRNRKSPDYQITLIEIENIDAFGKASGVPLAPHEPRRNVVTRGISLNALCGKRFRVGSVELEGLELCEPCALFAKRTRPDVVRFFVHKGGLRARVIQGGILSVGDSVGDL